MPGMFPFLARRRRAKLIASPLAPHQLVLLGRNVAHYARLAPARQQQVQDFAKVTLAEFRFEGGRNHTVTDEMRLTVCAQLGLLCLRDTFDYFAFVPSIVVYDTPFRRVMPGVWGDNEEDEVAEETLSGEAVNRGPVILNWQDVSHECKHPELGNNLVLHEFAHQLDFAGPDAPGVPPMPRADVANWQRVMADAIAVHARDLAEHGEGFFSSDATEPVEFFADAVEAFYCSPADFRLDFAELYGLMAGYFGVDPASWAQAPAKAR